MRDQTYFGVYGVSYQFGDFQAVKGISIECERGEFLALVGPNGSGKSTFLKAVAGLYSYDRSSFGGMIRLRGREMTTLSVQERAKEIFYVPSKVETEFPMSARECVSLGRINFGNEIFGGLSEEDHDLVQWAMEKTHTWEFREHDYSTLSGGEKQRIILAQALCRKVKVLLLDESVSNVDLHHQASMGRVLRELTKEGTIVVLVSHDLNLATEWAERCILLNKGEKIADGSVNEILDKESLGKVYPHQSFCFGKNPMTGKPKVFWV